MKRLLACLLCLFLLTGTLLTVAETPRGVMYEVCVRAFSDSNGDGIGDLKGLQNKLPYLKDLGVSHLWLMPIFPSPSYHGYDVTDYEGINPDYGTMADFESFLSAAHEAGIKVLLDIPFNHTSDKHPWFVASQKKDDPKRAWYRWDEAPTKETLTLTVWGQKPWKTMGKAAYYALFWEGMPDLNLDNTDAKQAVIDIGLYWLDKGVDGFRLDAASHLYAQGEEGPRQDIDKANQFWLDFNTAMKAKNPDSLVMAEVWESADKRAQMLEGLDSVVNFGIGDTLIPLIKTGGAGASVVKGWLETYQLYEKQRPDVVDLPFLTNHDQNRVFAQLVYKVDKAKLAASVLMTLPGLPIIYYGEEIGMSGAKPDEEIRTPMLWGGGDKAETSWHPSRYNKKTVPLSEQEKDPDSLYQHYKKMIALRLETSALRDGRMAAGTDFGPLPLSWRMVPRAADGKTALVIHNPQGKTIDIPWNEGYRVIYPDMASLSIKDGVLQLAPYASVIVEEP